MEYVYFSLIFQFLRIWGKSSQYIERFLMQIAALFDYIVSWNNEWHMLCNLIE